MSGDLRHCDVCGRELHPGNVWGVCGRKRGLAECLRERGRRRYQRKRKGCGPPGRTCAVCGRGISKNNSIGVCWSRKATSLCAVEARRRYEERNEERIREKAKSYRSRPEIMAKRSACRRAWHVKNKEAVIARRRLVRKAKHLSGESISRDKNFGMRHQRWCGGKDVFCAVCRKNAGYREPGHQRRNKSGLYGCCRSHSSMIAMAVRSGLPDGSSPEQFREFRRKAKEQARMRNAARGRAHRVDARMLAAYRHKEVLRMRAYRLKKKLKRKELRNGQEERERRAV